MMMKELEFEQSLVEYLSTGTIEGPAILRERGVAYGGSLSAAGDPTKGIDYVYKTQLWQPAPALKTTEDLWRNFKTILELHNAGPLQNKPLSAVEFEQVKRIISSLDTPYKAGQFLYGTNGVSQVEVDLDDGRHVFLTVFDQKQIGAGDTIYQVVNQIERPAVIPGKQPRRFDTTLLINGLPMIQIEEKASGHSAYEALTQMEQYVHEGQYSDIFSTVQILIGMTPNDILYMANAPASRFNKDFAFRWQRRSDNRRVHNWKEFADMMLSIPMAHQMATNFMILDGTKNKEMLKVMRPYQVYATQTVIEELKKIDFSAKINRVGYIWHTTGSGKTITSFKTAWLASRMPNVDLVVFLVDRIALTKQTSENYQAYDPDAGDILTGSVSDTENTTDLSSKLKNQKNGIIVTSVQKLDTLVKRKSFKAPNKRILFIVDEAHRSTGGDSFKNIQQSFPHAAWVGYTGTPMFESTSSSGVLTRDIFGPALHRYTIREAISDGNVLGFKVEFETTLDTDKMKTEYLPKFYQNRYPKWTDADIQRKINNLTIEDIDDTIEPSLYDENYEHVKLVVEDIFKNWRVRSVDYKYNALLTTHVGGGKASTPMAIMYFDEFQRVNKERIANGQRPLKVAITFSLNTSNRGDMVASNEGLFRAITAYNEVFGTAFTMSDIPAYTQDVTSRLNKSASDKNYLDLVIVVDQLLTGFDAPEMNTLYVDRILRGANLIQAYSRTNRIADKQEKPWGTIVNYRWPAQNEKLMNRALAVYANLRSADEQESLFDDKDDRDEKELKAENILVPTFKTELAKTQDIVEELRKLTNDFDRIPASETQQDNMLKLLREYNQGMAKLKLYEYKIKETGAEGFDYDNPDEIIRQLGMTPDEETILTKNLTNELKAVIAHRKQVPVYEIELRLTHIKDVEVNYDYLDELVAQLLNEVHEKQMEAANETRQKIEKFANSLDDRSEASKIMRATDAVMDGSYTADNYPVKPTECRGVVEKAYTINVESDCATLRRNWGIQNIIDSKSLRELIQNHTYQANDLNDNGAIDELLIQGAKVYTITAEDEAIRKLSKIKYRNGLRNAIYEFADKLVSE